MIYIYLNIRKILLTLCLFLFCSPVYTQSNQVDFSTIPKSGTILIYAHHDDDFIWMLPWWNKTEKFIAGAMPSSPSFNSIFQAQQTYLNNNGYNIDYLSNWITPWSDISDDEYTQYYWGENPAYSYLQLDHLETRSADNHTPLSTAEINKIKAKLEQYIASPDVSRIITHNNWGEYGHQHHIDLNKAVRQLAVKYRKDVWMLGCSSRYFVDVSVPGDVTYTWGEYNTPVLFNALRNIYKNYGRWTWYDDTPTGLKRYIKIVDGGNDESGVFGDPITTPGSYQDEPGAFIFDGNDDYMTLQGNNNSSFTVAMWIKPEQIYAMDISKMAEYPSSGTYDRNFYLQGDGRVSARIYDGSSRVVTSNTAVNAGVWSHIAMTSNGNTLKIYVNGALDNSTSAGTAITSYSTPEFIIGQTALTSSYFYGQINTVGLYNYAMTDAQIAELSGVGYTITSSAGTGGSITPSGVRSFSGGESQTYTIAANTGYEIADVKVDNSSVGVVSSYTFNNISARHTISATFTPFTYTIQSTAGSNGTISPSGNRTVNYGTSQTYTISANTGYEIADVLVDNVSVGSVSSFTFSNITSNHTITASFTPLVYIIAASSGSNGSINPSGPVSVNYGANQTFSITPNSGYQVADVRVDNSSIGALSSYTFSNVRADHSIAATFSLITYTITGTAGTGGSISPSGATTVTPGSNRTYTITANTGYEIADVRVDNVSIGAVASYTFSDITANHTISATFTPFTYTIQSTAGSNGTISPSGNRTVNYGTSQTYTISANTGYEIADVLVDNVSVGSVSSFTFSNITSNHTITASFTPLVYIIAASSGSNGSINPSGPVSVDYGANQTFSITPNSGYQVADVRVDNSSIGAFSSYTFSNVRADHSIAATFSLITYTITGTAGTGGSISPSGATTVTPGSNRTYTITANTGYEIADVRVDNVSIGAVASYTFSDITANHTISATFTPFTYTIQSTAGSNGTISPSGNRTVNYGTSQTYTISANTGYEIADVLVDNVSVGSVSSFTFSNITSNHTITVSFGQITYDLTATAGLGGTISPSGTITLIYGANQTFTINANEGYQIADVLVDDVSVGIVSSYTFSNITSTHSISVLFAPIIYTISSTTSSGGTISPSGTFTVNHGEDLVLRITAQDGFMISDVIVDNVSVGSVSSYSFSNIETDHSIHVKFEPLTYTMASKAGSNGSIDPSGEVLAIYGTNLTYTITADEGYMISNVKVDNISLGAISSYTFTTITASHSISASFKPITYYITSSSSDLGGMIYPLGTVQVNSFENKKYSITAYPGYKIRDVIVDNVSVGSISEYTFMDIQSDHSISAVFTRLDSTVIHHIESSAGSGGAISPAGTVSVNQGTNQTYSIIPDREMKISNVTVDGTSLGAITSYTFHNNSDNHSIVATFVPLDYFRIVSEIPGSGGLINPMGERAIQEGSDITYHFDPQEGFRVLNVYVDGAAVGASSSYTFNNVRNDHSLSVRFTPDIYVQTYPNPFKDDITVRIFSSTQFLFDITIADQSGKFIHTLSKVPGNEKTLIDLPDVTAGVYLLTVILENEVIATLRIIKNK